MHIRQVLLRAIVSLVTARAGLPPIDFDNITLREWHGFLRGNKSASSSLVTRAAPENLIGTHLFMNGEYYGEIENREHAQTLLDFHNTGETMNSMLIDNHLEQRSEDAELHELLSEAYNASVANVAGPDDDTPGISKRGNAQKASLKAMAAAKAAKEHKQSASARAKAVAKQKKIAAAFTAKLAQNLKGETQTQNNIRAQDWFKSLNKAAADEKALQAAKAAKKVGQIAAATIAKEKADGDHGCIHYIDPAHPCCSWYYERGIDMCHMTQGVQITNHYYNSKTFMKGFYAKLDAQTAGKPLPNWDPKVEQQRWFKDHPGHSCSDDLITGSLPCTNPTAEWFAMHPYGVYGLTRNVGAEGGSGSGIYP